MATHATLRFLSVEAIVMRPSGLRLLTIGSVLLLAVGGLGLASVGKQNPPPPFPSFDPAPASPLPQIRLTQASSKCSTSAGICFVEPLPVGSPCTCGDFSGVIIP